MLDGERLAPRRTCLEHTALVADAAARTVDVAQMDLDAGESGIESIDCPGQNLFEPFALCIGQRNVAVSVDEDLHQYLRSEEHTSELQSLMRISYAVFCLKKKNTNRSNTNKT